MKQYLPNYFEVLKKAKLQAKSNAPLRNDKLDSVYVKIAILSEMQSELIDEANSMQETLNPQFRPTKVMLDYRESLVYFSEQMLHILMLDKKISSSTIYNDLFKRIDFLINKHIKQFR